MTEQFMEINSHIGEVGMPDDTILITCSLNSGVEYSDGDLFFDTQEIANAVRLPGDSCILQSIHILDKDDQAMDFILLFLNDAVSLGAENDPIDISDENAEKIIGSFSFSNEYVDLVNNQIRTEQGIGLMLEALQEKTSLYVAAIAKGAGTFSANGINITFGFLRN